jgi:hypothetical protein
MGDKGKRDKGGREKRKKPKLDPKERKKLKREKQYQHTTPTVVPLTPPTPPAQKNTACRVSQRQRLSFCASHPPTNPDMDDQTAAMIRNLGWAKRRS